MQWKRLPVLAEYATVRNWAHQNTGQMQILSRDSQALNENPNLGLGSNLEEKTNSSTGCRTRGTLYILKQVCSRTHPCHRASNRACQSDEFISACHTRADLCDMLPFFFFSNIILVPFGFISLTIKPCSGLSQHSDPLRVLLY